MYEIKELTLDEISLVDVPANVEARVLIYKRNTQPEPTAQPGEKAPRPMTREELEETLDLLAKNHRKPGETHEQAYSRIAKTSPVGKLAVQLLREMPADPQPGEATAQAETTVERTLFGDNLTPAEKHFAFMVDDYRRSGLAPPDMPLQQLFSKMWRDPTNADLRARAVAERAAVRTAGE